MVDPPVIVSKESKRTMLLIWAIAATLAALVSTGFAIFFWRQAQQHLVPEGGRVASSPFLDLPESALPGRYKWINKSGSDESFITLNEDHTFINKSGTMHPAHRWEITRDALVIVWLRSQTRFNRIERPGVYVETKDGIETTRMEKQE